MSADEIVVKAQFELCQRVHETGTSTAYRRADPSHRHVVLGHGFGYDLVAFHFACPPKDWVTRTCVIEVAQEPIAELGDPWMEGAVIIRYPAEYRRRLSAFVVDLIERTNPADVPGSADSVIQAWARLWRTISGPLDRRSQRGLFGELWVLEQLVLANGPTSTSGWEGPTGSLHDFIFPIRHIEVKTTGHSSPLLEVSSLEQLRPMVPPLHLVMLQVGEGRGTTLVAQVARLRDRLAGNRNELHTFERKLIEAGYLDDHAAHYGVNYVNPVASVLPVADDLPLLHRGTLVRPLPALIDAKWTLDPRALPFRAATLMDWTLR